MTGGSPAPTIADVCAEAQKRGIDFYFAQFVDMYARPSAKLVPATYLDELLEESAGFAGFAGFAAGEMARAPITPTSWPGPI